MDELKKYCDRYEVNYNGCFLLLVHLVSTGGKKKKPLSILKS